MSTRRFRLGILQVNHDKSVEVGDKFPDDAHRFRDLFDAMDEVRFQYRVYMTIGGELPADVHEQDAYLITGSPLSVLDDLPWFDDLCAFIRKCDQAQKPLLGVCFGHQAVAVALGGQVERATSGWNVGVETCLFRGQRAWIPKNSEGDDEADGTREADGALSLFVFHQDQVTRLPPGAVLLGSTQACQYASMAKGSHIFTTQAHPEFTPAFMRCLLDHMANRFTPGAFKAIKRQLDLPTQGQDFAHWATRFFIGAKP